MLAIDFTANRKITGDALCSCKRGYSPQLARNIDRQGSHGFRVQLVSFCLVGSAERLGIH
jgi:hypothetical protein